MKTFKFKKRKKTQVEECDSACAAPEGTVDIAGGPDRWDNIIPNFKSARQKNFKK